MYQASLVTQSILFTKYIILQLPLPGSDLFETLF